MTTEQVETNEPNNVETDRPMATEAAEAKASGMMAEEEAMPI